MYYIHIHIYSFSYCSYRLFLITTPRKRKYKCILYNSIILGGNYKCLLSYKKLVQYNTEFIQYIQNLPVPYTLYIYLLVHIFMGPGM